jgi:hypothetical protein
MLEICDMACPKRKWITVYCNVLPYGVAAKLISGMIKSQTPRALNYCKNALDHYKCLPEFAAGAAKNNGFCMEKGPTGQGLDFQ